MKSLLTLPVDTPPQAYGLDRELQFGPGMRVQRLTEAAFMVAALFTQDVRFAYVTFAFSVLQAISPRWAPVARMVARLVHFSGEHRIGDLYFDLGGSRGACAISVVVQAVGIVLVWAGHPTIGFIILTIPTASFLMAPTLGFCAGCWFYVLGRDWLARRGWLKRGFDDFDDIAIGGEIWPNQPELRSPAQR
jgi:Domain of unknown function (DUF4395)